MLLPLLPGESEKSPFTFISFLHYLNNSHEFEIYYWLMNQAYVESFTHKKVIIVSSISNHKIKEQLSKLFFSWTGLEWEVIISFDKEIEVFKSRLLKKVEESLEWEMIKESFPESAIADLLLKA